MRRVVSWAGLLALVLGAACGGESSVRRAPGAAGEAADGGRGGSQGGRASSTGGRIGSAGGRMGAGGAAASGATAGGGAGEAGEGAGRSGAGAAGDGGVPGDAGQGGEAGAPVEPSEDMTRDILTTDLVIDTSTRRCIATITLAPSESEGASFEIGNLDIESVEQDGKPLLYADRGARLDVGVAASPEPITLTIGYSYRAHDFFDGISNRDFTFTWPESCGNVFPCHSDPNDGVRFSLHVSGAGSPAIQATEIPFDAPSYMLGWTSASLEELELGTTAAGTQVSAFYEPTDPLGRVHAIIGTEYLLPAFDWLEVTLGDYVFGSKVASVSVDWPSDQIDGMEHHPFWHVRQDLMREQLIHVHEAAHGWFGNGVRLRCWNDLVLSEGTASYLALRALEAAGSTAEAAAGWEEYESWVDLARSSSPSPAWPEGCAEFDSVVYAFGPLMYARGALFLRALEERVGRATFDLALRGFYQTFVGKAAGLSELLATVYLRSGYDAQACAEAWLRSDTLPEFVPCD